VPEFTQAQKSCYQAAMKFAADSGADTYLRSMPRKPMLRVDVVKQLGEFSLEAAFESEGRVTGLFGASGAGKTSLVSMIAGLLRPDRGTISIDGEIMDDTEKAIHVPTWRRRIGYVFQNARLFPHRDVAQNLDYGRRMNGLADDPAQRKRVTELLDIGHLLDRRPGKLSGGERQRVALGRALLSKPRLLLLDDLGLAR
jgi:molybdate transport system ATP-binding protein